MQRGRTLDEREGRGQVLLWVTVASVGVYLLYNTAGAFRATPSRLPSHPPTAPDPVRSRALLPRERNSHICIPTLSRSRGCCCCRGRRRRRRRPLLLLASSWLPPCNGGDCSRGNPSRTPHAHSAAMTAPLAPPRSADAAALLIQSAAALTTRAARDCQNKIQK